ncbi:glycosyltransferase family 2 protein [Microvirga sp. KLBC 81]|uniref:glycosyltransferase family 2 protein n=1 Tax=Microvirga sp. KLBC 81 TaxID=1862707 RepID=UPI000D517D10|nr:glycosyltransferase family 2 protein [Microvirga sp. KLBC 81]PVE21062.1 glycosyltransferase family 2 protein [Microvirga sp. KLBC 81]
MTVVFWILVGIIFYSYIGYGLMIIGLSRLAGRRREHPAPVPQRATLLIAAYNEAGGIGQKIENALSLATGIHTLEIVVASDGSTDGTADIAHGYEQRGVRVVEVKEHYGKAFALNQALSEINSDVVIFSDANSTIEAQAIVRLLDHFADPDVGGVCGSLGVPERSQSWLARGERLYWRYDHALKKAESALAGAVSAQGSLYAIRRSLIKPIPSAVADDLISSLRVVDEGKRLVFEPGAQVFEAVTNHTGSEFGRRVRSTERGWRGLMSMARLMNPGRTGFYALQLFSHKALRRLVPFLAVLLVFVSVMTMQEGWIYVLAAGLQILFFVLAFIGWRAKGRVGSWASVPFFIVMGNTAMMVGVINVLRGKRSSVWTPARISVEEA